MFANSKPAQSAEIFLVQDDAKKENLFRSQRSSASARAIEASCNAKLSHTSKAMLRPPPARALPQSRHSERGAFTRLSAKNLLATRASQTLFLMAGHGRRSFDCALSRFAQDDAKGKPLRCNGTKASVKALEDSCKDLPQRLFILTDPRPLPSFRPKEIIAKFQITIFARCFI